MEKERNCNMGSAVQAQKDDIHDGDIGDIGSKDGPGRHGKWKSRLG